MGDCQNANRSGRFQIDEPIGKCRYRRPANDQILWELSGKWSRVGPSLNDGDRTFDGVEKFHT